MTFHERRLIGAETCWRRQETPVDDLSACSDVTKIVKTCCCCHLVVRNPPTLSLHWLHNAKWHHCGVRSCVKHVEGSSTFRMLTLQEERSHSQTINKHLMFRPSTFELHVFICPVQTQSIHLNSRHRGLESIQLTREQKLVLKLILVKCVWWNE